MKGYDATSFMQDGSLITKDLVADQEEVVALIVQYRPESPLLVVAYDEKGTIWGTALQIFDSKSIYKYLIFDQTVIPSKISFFDDRNHITHQVGLAAVMHG